MATQKSKNDMGPRHFRLFTAAQREVKTIKATIDKTFDTQVIRQRGGGEACPELSGRIKKLRLELKEAQQEVKRVRSLPRFEDSSSLKVSFGGVFGQQLKKFRKQLAA